VAAQYTTEKRDDLLNWLKTNLELLIIYVKKKAAFLPLLSSQVALLYINIYFS